MPGTSGDIESRLTDGVTRTVLMNGIVVLVKENHVSPVAALLVSIKSGYFNEADPVSGIAHVVEHMIFKGTPLRPEVEQFAREIRELGGSLNAATYYEETYYYVMVPSRSLPQALEIQADALQNALFDAAELKKEIEVIVQESLQKRDNPAAMLNESLYELAYDTHRIRRWRIGHPEPLRALTRDNLAQFVAETYRPENIVVSVVGDFDATRVIELVDRTWGSVPRGQLRREPSPLEAKREEFRYRRLTGEHRQRLLLFHFPAPPLLHPDGAALLVLSAILSDGRSARLFRRLKEELQIANSAWASYETFEQMGAFKIGAECVNDDPLPVEQAIWAEIRRAQQQQPTEEELLRIKTRIEASRLYTQEEVFGMARALATYEILGDYRLSDAFNAALQSVTGEDVQRVAREYLNLSSAALLEYLPAEPGTPERTVTELMEALSSPGTAREASERSEVAGVPPALDIEAPTPDAATAAPRSADARPAALTGRPHEARTFHLPGGGLLIVKERRDLPVVAVHAMFSGGKPMETRNSCGLTSLMLKSSLKGTRSLNAEEFASRVEAIGASLGASPGPDYFTYGLKMRRDNLREAFHLLHEALIYPEFPDAEVEREKQALLGEIRRQQDSSVSLAYEQFAAAYFGEHPYGLPSIGIEEAIAAQDPAALRRWHDALVRPSNLVACIVGDVQEQEVFDLFATLFPNEAAGAPMPQSTPFNGPEPPSERALARRKKQTASALGFTGAPLGSDDRYALDLVDEITSAMGGRFFRAVRGENALAYSVSSVHRSRRDAGNFITYTSTAPENEERAREILLAECARLGREPVTEQELRTAKATLYGEQVIGTQTFGAQASQLAYFALNGLPLDEAERYLDRIQTVTAEEIMGVASRHLTPDRYWLGVVRGVDS